MKKTKTPQIPKKYPVMYKGKLYKYKDCNDIFNSYYTIIESLDRKECCVYVTDGSWVYPDGTFKYDENR